MRISNETREICTPCLTQVGLEVEPTYQFCQEAIGDGWGADTEITPLLIADVLIKEAAYQDGCVARGETDPSYPAQLRRAASLIASKVAQDLYPDTAPSLRAALTECITEGGARCMTDESRNAASLCRRRLDAISEIARAALRSK